MTSFDPERLVPRVSRPWILVAVLVWSLALAYETTNQPMLSRVSEFTGPVQLETQVFSGQFGDWAVGKASDLGELSLDFGEPVEASRGDVLEIEARVVGNHLQVDDVVAVHHSNNLLYRVGGDMREWTLHRLEPMSDGRALLAGFLIGDTSSIDPADVDAMRRSGLAHFVAVSGSNVALFLMLLAVVAGPLAMGPKRRAVVGLVGLPFYAAVTQFEPSVLRASVMAAIALGGRLVDLIFEAWQLLSLAVVVLVVTDPSLTANVGFQLSVAATAGVVVGARWPVRGRVTRALAVTLGAQVFVAPLLLAHFDTVPLMSPLTNLVTAPLVAAATALGAAGLLLPPALDLAAWLAEVVLGIARFGAGWPQVSGGGLLLALAIGALALLSPPLRPVVAGCALVALSLITVPHGRPPAGSVVVLDVGQGDAILIHGGDERFVLVDGGPDPVVLQRRLRDHGVSSIEAAILSHVHADHASGLVGIIGRIPIGRFIADTSPHETAASRELMERAEQFGITIETPRAGQQLNIGAITLHFEGPLRRYASPNDQSIVVTAVGRSRSMLLSGDVETFAQADLEHLRADVLKVPHQGAATSDRSWLVGVDADLAVISVGPNQFGHPADWVIEALESSGAQVVRTDLVGDVVVDLS